MEVSNYNEVYFDEWCSKCKYEKCEEYEDPCWYCLDEPVNIDSHKPIEFVSKR